MYKKFLEQTIFRLYKNKNDYNFGMFNYNILI